MSLYASTQIDNYIKPEEIVETEESRTVDPGTNWEEVPASWLEGFGANGGFNFMDAKGFRYYLPACMAAYLRASLDTSGAWIYESLIYHLCGLDDSALSRPYAPEHYSILTRTQGRCVAHFLEYARSWYFAGEEYGTEHARLGLDGYWKQFLV